MATYIGQASCDELGNYMGGQAGNQSGTELNVREAYLYDWKSLIRFTEPSRAAACGAAMAEAVANMAIGYDQAQRNTILGEARACGWKLSAITQACECDCSSLAGVCGIAAGAPEEAIYVGGNLCYTGNIVERFEGTGMVSAYSTSDYVKSCVKWQVGDILVSDTHAVVVIAGTASEGVNVSGDGSNLSGSGEDSWAVGTSSDIDELAHAVIAGRFGNGEVRRAALGVRFDEVQARVNELLGCASGTSVAADTTGTNGIVPESYKVVCGELNVRSNPSLAGDVVAMYERGQYIHGIASDVVEAGGYVWVHYTAFSGNVRYVALGTVDGGERYLVKG